MAPESHPALGVERYVVRVVRGGWRVSCGDRDLDIFPDSEAAASEACRAARQAAIEGRVSLVVVETTPQELHCFMPRPQASASPAPAPGYLRLVTPGARSVFGLAL